MKKTTKKRPTTDQNSIPEEYEITELDIYSLHTECQKQDGLVQYWGEKLAAARLRWEQLKAAAQVFEAETSRRIRQKPKNYGVTRLTEAAIKEVVAIEVLTSSEHDKVIRAKYKIDLLEVAMRRLEHRKKAIENCVFLHGQQYYAAPKVSRNERTNNDSRIRGIKH